MPLIVEVGASFKSRGTVRTTDRLAFIRAARNVDPGASYLPAPLTPTLPGIAEG